MPYTARYIMGGAWEEGVYQEVDHSCFGLYLLAWWWTLAVKCACDDTSQTSESKQLFLETFFLLGLKLLNLLKKKKSMQKHFFPRNRHLLLIMFVGISASQPYIPLDVLSCLSFYCLKVGGLSIAVREGEFPVQLGERDKQSSDLILKADGSLLSACHGAA